MSTSHIRPHLDILWKIYVHSKEAAARWTGSLARQTSYVDFSVPLEIGASGGTRRAPRTVKRFLQTEYLRILRETLFVRAISALEVYLVDTVRWIFLHRRELFSREGGLELAYGELLAATTIGELHGKFISKECRQLQNKGFLEIRKYYRARFTIDFGDSTVNLDDLEQFHDIRHLLVHRLGKTDARYRKLYKTRLPRVRVTENDFFATLTLATRLSDYVHNRVRALIRVSGNARLDPRNLNVRLDMVDVSPAAEKLLDPDFAMSRGGSVTYLRDILVSQVGDSTERVIVLSGAKGDVQAYLRLVASLEAKDELLVQSKKLLTDGHQCSLTAEQIAQIAARLPGAQLPKHIHKRIATDLGLSATQVSRAIGIILEKPDEYPLGGGAV